jgi:hypothetical protein
LEATTLQKRELIGCAQHAQLVNQSKCERAWVIADGEADADTKTQPVS